MGLLLLENPQVERYFIVLSGVSIDNLSNLYIYYHAYTIA
jgi:hypothetical protein